MKFLWPNLLTAGNLLFGGLALWLCSHGRFTEASASILLCTLMDGLDGRVARWLRAESSFGRWFDSGADLVSFGCAPAFAFWLRHRAAGALGGAAALAYLACAALRLIRFHRLCRLGESPRHRHSFVGLPTTASGGLYAAAALVLGPLPSGLDLGLLLLLAALMVSPLPFPSLEGLLPPAAAVRGSGGATTSTPFPG